MTKVLPFRLCCLVVLAAAVPPSPAQNIFGTILGTVRDPSGSPVAGVEVVATDVGTNQPARMTTNNAGYYEFPYLKPAAYTVRVSCPGFKTAERAGVELRVEDRTRLDFSLELGEVSTSVAVTDKIPPVQSESASLGQVVDDHIVQEMPLGGRNVFELAGLAAGVVVNPTAEDRVVAEGGFDSSDISIGGGRFRSNEYLLDGVTVMLPANNNHAITPTPEGTKELKVMTGNSGSQFGRTGGGTVNVVTKGGTNEFHGTAWEYFRNELLRANDFFANARGQDRGAFRFQMLGGTYGGPIRRDKTFFFAEYQATRRQTPAQGAYTFPDQVQRTGDFSSTLVSTGQAVAIYDPFTTVAGPGGKGYVRSPFPGNVIPRNRFDRLSAGLLGYLPQPNRAGDGPAHIDNFLYSGHNNTASDQGSMRIDHRFSDRHGIFGRVTRTVTRINSPATLDSIADGNGDNQVQGYANGVINGTYVLGPKRVANYRFGWTRWCQNMTPTYLGRIKLAELGFPPYIPANAQLQLFPRISMAGYSRIGSSGPRRDANSVYAWVADYTEIRGIHTFKFGGDVRVYDVLPYNPAAPAGSYSFSNAFTQGPDPQRAARGFGDGFASFLLGYGSGSMDYVPAFAVRNGYFGFYASDDIRLRRLTINLGLRWDYEQPRTERYDRFATFDFRRPFPVKVAALPELRGMLTHPGLDGYPRGQFDKATHNFGPHIGLAYRLRSATAVRAAFGIVFSPRIGYTSARNFGSSGADMSTQWVSSLDGVTPLNPFSNPFPTGVFVRSSSLPDQLLMGQGLTMVDRNSKNNSYMQQWNLSVQQGLPGRWVLEGAYVGSRGIRLPIAGQYNQLDPRYMSLGTELSRQLPNPFYGLVSTGTLAAATVTRAQLLRPYPQYLGISTYIQTAAWSQYHGAAFTANRRYGNGFTLIVAYTIGKTIDNGAGRVLGVTGLQPPIQNAYDLTSEKSLSQQDVSQRLVIGHTVELPFGNGKPLLSAAPAPIRAIVSGWVASGQAVLQTGFPLWLSSNGNSGVFSAVLRPNNTGRSAALSGDVESRLNRFFDTSAFTIPEPYTFGNTSRALPDARGPGRRNYNLGVSRRFHVRERVVLLFRGETYNLSNTPVFGFPGTKLGANNFGVISSAGGSRQMQLSVRAQF